MAQRRAIAVKRIAARERAQILRARESCSAFIEYVLRNEADGSRLRNAKFHQEWQRLLDENKQVVLGASVEHAKSQQVSIGRVLFEIGLNPNIRIALISNTEKLAKKLLKQIRAEIERNPRLPKVFPNLRRSSRTEDPWSATELTVERQTIARDPTVQALGAFGAIVGSRLDRIVLDDVLDFDNTRTEEQRLKLIDWFDTTVYTRALDEACIWAIGTPWHPDDLLHNLAGRPGFVCRWYPAVENPDDPPRRWRPIWPEQWPLSRLLHRRANMLEHHFIRKYLCRVRLDATSRCKKVWLERAAAMGKGRTFELVAPPRLTKRGPPLPCFTGIDLSVGEPASKKKAKSARTVIWTFAMLPDGRRLLVNIESGEWQSPEIVERIERTYQAYRSEILVESNQAQKYIIQWCKGRVPVHGLHTGSGNKFDEEWGVESIMLELKQQLWIFPSGAGGTYDSVHEETKSFFGECLHFDPAAHTGDRLMAAWLARECARRWGLARGVRLDTLRR